MKKIINTSIVILLVYFSLFGQEQEKDIYPGLFLEEWQEMNQSQPKEETREWFQDAKFGMFIHWGLYSIPAGVWKGKKIHEYRGPHLAEWIMYAAEIPREEYAQLANQFNPIKFDADAIALLAKAAGMKYIVITSKHHDGFALYDSKVSEYDIMDASPFKRDIVKELHKACKKHGLEFGVYYSHNIDWNDGSDAQSALVKVLGTQYKKSKETLGANTWDPSQSSFEDYLINKAFPQVNELMTQYPDMKLLWYDMSHRMFAEQSYAFYKKVYDIQPHILICDRVGNGFGDYSIPGDNEIPNSYKHLKKPWETVGTFNNSWGYNSYDNDWKSPQEVLFWLIEIVSKGGNYMLNIGPTAEGVVPQPSVTCLNAIGDWLEINGEAIYGTQRWETNHEGPTKIEMRGTGEREKHGFNANFTINDFWFTQKGNDLYAICLTQPDKKTESIQINSFNLSVGKISKVEVIGKGEVKFEQTAEKLTVSLPKKFNPEYGFVVKVSLNK